MKTSVVKRFRDRLHKLKAELEEVEKASQESTKPVELDPSRVGRLTRMDAMQGREMARESARRRQQKIAMINAALKRIEDDGYGYCLVCDEEIDIRRLELDPSTPRCISCAE